MISISLLSSLLRCSSFDLCRQYKTTAKKSYPQRKRWIMLKSERGKERRSTPELDRDLQLYLSHSILFRLVCHSLESLQRSISGGGGNGRSNDISENCKLRSIEQIDWVFITSYSETFIHCSLYCAVLWAIIIVIHQVRIISQSPVSAMINCVSSLDLHDAIKQCPHQPPSPTPSHNQSVHVITRHQVDK